MDDLSQPVDPCLHCGKAVAIKGPDPVTVSLESSNDKYQTFYAHSACIEKHAANGNGIELNLR